LIGLILGSNLVNTIVTLFINKRMRQADAKLKEAEVADVISRTYAGIIKNLNDEVNRLKTLNEELRAEVNRLDNRLKERGL